MGLFISTEQTPPCYLNICFNDAAVLGPEYDADL